MAQYRRRTFVIEAHQLVHVEIEPTAREDFAAWAAALGYVGYEWSGEQLLLPTSRGLQEANYGDWVIRSGTGEFYALSPAEFEASYEAI